MSAPSSARRKSSVAAATEFERACAQRRASQAAQAGGEEDDEGETPIVKEPTEEMSRVNAATLQLFRDTCKSLAKGLMDSYETWPNRIVRAPDPFKRVPFNKDAWECLDIDFFDVSFYGPLIDVTCLAKGEAQGAKLPMGGLPSWLHSEGGRAVPFRAVHNPLRVLAPCCDRPRHILADLAELVVWVSRLRTWRPSFVKSARLCTVDGSSLST
jgi:hypothetical protein